MNENSELKKGDKNRMTSYRIWDPPMDTPIYGYEEVLMSTNCGLVIGSHDMSIGSHDKSIGSHDKSIGSHDMRTHVPLGHSVVNRFVQCNI